jgi:hypothetical protein
MHARVITFQMPPEQLDGALANIRQGTQNVRSQPGLLNAYWLWDAERTTLTAIILFESAEAEAENWQRTGPDLQERWRAAGAEPEIRVQEVVHSV